MDKMPKGTQYVACQTWGPLAFTPCGRVFQFNIESGGPDMLWKTYQVWKEITPTKIIEKENTND